MEDLDKLVQEAEELKNMDYQSPRIHLWENRTKQFVQNKYGDDYLEILERALNWGRVIMEGEGQQMHREAIDRAIEFLNALKNEPNSEPSDSRPLKKQETKPGVPSRFGDLRISGGNVFFGDGNTLTQIYVKDIVEALSREIQEKIPDSTDKVGVLESLKKLTTNETFASVTGSFVGEILKSLIR